MRILLVCGLFAAITPRIVAAGDVPITRIWLTHASHTPDSLTVNWETPEPGPSRVEYGPSEALGTVAALEERMTLHHVPLPFPPSGFLFYKVQTENAQSQVHRIKSYEGDTLRIAVAADWQEMPSLDALEEDDPHLLISCGDLTHGLIRFDDPGDLHYTAPFSHLVDRYPELFAATPFMPVLGNHDRQLFPRILRPPPLPSTISTRRPTAPSFPCRTRAGGGTSMCPGTGCASSPWI